MKIGLEKASGRAICRYIQCEQKPEYINERGCIKNGTTCAFFTMSSASGWHTSYFCRDCIDKIYRDVKAILDPKLWAFR